MGNASALPRQLSVMLCDFVGSAALSEHLDPEDLCDGSPGGLDLGAHGPPLGHLTHTVPRAAP